MAEQSDKIYDLKQQVILSAVIVCLIVIIEISIEIFAAPLTTDEILETDWNTYSYGIPALSLSIPKELKPGYPAFPQDLWKYLQGIEAYSFKESNVYRFSVNHMTYMLFIKPNLKQAAEGMIEELKNEKSVMNVKFKETPYALGTVQGLLHHGTYDKNEESIEFTNLFLNRGSDLWLLTMNHGKNDVFARKINEKILKSLVIEK